MRINGAELHVEDTGGAGPAIVFSHGLLWSMAMWRFQVEAFRGRHRCILPFHTERGVGCVRNQFGIRRSL